MPVHFGADLDMIPKRKFRNLEDYLALFAGATTQVRLGESTPFYLYSKLAAQEIRDFDPAARIIIMLRHPVDMMYSMHARNLMDGNEVIKDFAAALEAEPRRKSGRSLPASCFFRQGLYYRDLARFAEQVKRYQDQFDRTQIHVTMFDDLKAEPQESLNKVFTFLGLEKLDRPALMLANKSVTVRSPALAGFLRDPPGALRRLPAGLRQALIWRLNRWNTATPARPPIDQALRRQLVEEFSADIRELGSLLQRDLSNWLK